MITKSALREAIVRAVYGVPWVDDVTHAIIKEIEQLEDLIVIDDEIAEPLEEEDVMDSYSEEEL